MRAAFLFTIRGGKIAAIDLVMEPARLAGLDVKIARGQGDVETT